MPITRIEMISIAPKSQEASSQRQNEVSKSFAEQTQIQAGFHKEIQHNSQQTTKSAKGENGEYRFDAKEKGNNSYKNQGNKNKKKNQKEDNEIKLSNFDIKI